MWDIANGKYKAGVPRMGSPFYVDARDVALAHVRAIELDAAKGQRYLLIGGSYVCCIYLNLNLASTQHF